MFRTFWTFWGCFGFRLGRWALLGEWVFKVAAVVCFVGVVCVLLGDSWRSGFCYDISETDGREVSRCFCKSGWIVVLYSSF